MVGKLRRRHLAAVTPLGKLRAVFSVPHSNLAASSARMHAVVPPPLGLCAHPCSAVAAVFDDELTLTSAASSSISPEPAFFVLAPLSSLNSDLYTRDLCALDLCSHVTL